MPRFAASQRWLYVVVGALALVVPPLLLRAEPDNWSAVQSIVANMPQPERDRLDRNTKDYKELPEDQREQYRRLHAALEDDAANRNGKLNATMEGYYAWLGSNPAFERQELRRLTNPDQRLAEVQRVVDQRNEQATRWRSRRSRWWLQDAPDLTPGQLAVLMAKVEGRVQLNMDDTQRLRMADGSEKTGVVRYFTLFNIMGKYKYKLDQLLQNMDINATIEDVPGLAMPAWFAEAAPDARRFLFLRMIVGNVLKEYEGEVRRKSPSTQDLNNLVAHWPADRKDDLERFLEMEPADFRSELEREYARQSNSLDMRDLTEVLPDWRGGNGGRGRFPGMDGGRGPFRNRFGPEGRGPDGRPDGPRPGGPPPDDRGPPRDGERPPRRDGERVPAPVNPPPTP